MPDTLSDIGLSNMMFFRIVAFLATVSDLVFEICR
jgi:hypothetical protein